MGKRALLSLENEAILFAMSQAEEKPLLPFGDRSWEGFLIQEQDLLADRDSLGQVILDRILIASASHTVAYAARLRRVLTIGCAALYHLRGYSFPLISESDLAVTEMAYPLKRLSSLNTDLHVEMMILNATWASLFQGELKEAQFDSEDRHFALMVVYTVLEAIFQSFQHINEHLESLEEILGKGMPQQDDSDSRDAPPAILPVPVRWKWHDIGGCRRAKQ